MQTLQITNDNIQRFFLTPEEIKRSDEMRKKEEVKGFRSIDELSETEKYWIRRDHVELDVMHDQEMGEE